MYCLAHSSIIVTVILWKTAFSSTSCLHPLICVFSLSPQTFNPLSSLSLTQGLLNECCVSHPIWQHGNQIVCALINLCEWRKYEESIFIMCWDSWAWELIACRQTEAILSSALRWAVDGFIDFPECWNYKLQSQSEVQPQCSLIKFIGDYSMRSIEG